MRLVVEAKEVLRQLHAGNTTYLLWQVLGELAQQLRRWRDQHLMAGVEFTQHLESIRSLFTLALPIPIAFDHAVAIADRYQLSHRDSMLLGACQSTGVSVLYIEDMGSPRKIAGIELINPFAE